MDLSQWRAEVRRQTNRLRQQLGDLVQKAGQAVPGVVYGATASLAVLPLVVAVQSGTLPFVELVGLLGGLGVNLLSTELYDWRNRSRDELEKALPAQLGELAMSNTEWRELLDKLLEAAEAGAAVQAELGQVAEPFLAALQQDAQRLGSRLVIANVSNSQNVIIGDGSSLTTIIHHHYGDAGGSGAIPLNFDDVLCLYLARERRLCDELPLAKAKPDAQRIPRMQNVFVELRTTQDVDEAMWFDRLGVAPSKRKKLRQQLQEEAGIPRTMQRQAGGQNAPDEAGRAWFADWRHVGDEKLASLAKMVGVTTAQLRQAGHPLTPLEYLLALRSQGHAPHLVLLGDPGGGKSTWVRRLTSVLAWQRLTNTCNETLAPLGADEAAWLQAAQAAFGQKPDTPRGPAPIRIAMHRWASLARKGDLPLTGTAHDLVAVCARTLKDAHAVESINIHDHTLRLLQQGEAVILLDGLDEVSNDDQRRQMIAAVRAFAVESTYRNTPLLITCRSKPYARLKARGQGVLPDAHICTLGPLDDDAIHRFIDRWYAEMTWAERGERAKLIDDARRLHENLPLRPDLQRMAGTPLLLTMMARTNQESGLPNGRAELYENLVQELLWEWEKRRTYGEGMEAATATPEDDRSLLDILHTARADLSQAHLEQVLNQLAHAVHGDSGGDAVEIERETLEKWMRQLLPHEAGDATAKAAATELAVNIVNFIGQRTGLLVDIEDGQRFRFTHLTFQEYLAARWIATGGYGARLNKVKEKVDDLNWREVIFLAFGCMVSPVKEAYDDALVVIERLLHEPPERKPELVRLLLVGEAFVSQFTPEKLRLAEDVTARIETPKLVIRRLGQAMQVTTQAASDRLAAGLLLDELRGKHHLDPPGLDAFIDIPKSSFKMAKYPVTNSQFRRFFDAGGYGDAGGSRPVWWSKKGWEYKMKSDWTEPRFWDRRSLNLATQPVVGVSWYEAEAYCNWLNTPANNVPLPLGYRAQLPTQEQWMLAARNGDAEPTDDELDYPWDGAFDSRKANTKESDLRQTTPVDMYPGGATPAGVCDLAGNVWEWTADPNLKFDDAYWLKGGSWYEDGKQAKASAADRSGLVGFRIEGLGFRVVCVPIAHG